MTQRNLLSTSLLVLLSTTISMYILFRKDQFLFGGINVYFAMMSICVSFFYSFIYRKSIFPLPRNIAYIILMSSMLLLVAFVVYIVTGTINQYYSYAYFVLKRLGQILIGTCLLFSVHLCIRNTFRTRVLILTAILATTVSILCGLYIQYIGEPLLNFWINVAGPPESTLNRVLSQKRLSGLSMTIIGLSYNISVALPMTFSMLLYNPLCRKTPRIIWYCSFFGLLTIIVVGVITNATRSAFLGVIFSTIMISILDERARMIFKRLYKLIPLIFSVISAVFIIYFISKTYSTSTQTTMTQTTQKQTTTTKTTPKIHSTSKKELATSRLHPLSFFIDIPRMAMIRTAISYAIKHPFGMGVYSLNKDYIGSNLDEDAVRNIVMSSTPHNQFLVILVYYGFLGLGLLTAFYFLTIRSLFYSYLSAMQSKNSDEMFLVSSLGGSLLAYLINSLFHNGGPFVGDWIHFILIGLIANIPLIVRNQSNDY